MSENTITVTQVRSTIGIKPKARGTLRALGLGRIGQSNTLPDRPEIRGMIARVPHLISVDDDAPQGSVEADRSGQGVAETVGDAVAETVDTAADAADEQPDDESEEQS